MKPLAAAIFALLLIAPSPAQSPVPVANEPRHHLKFENKFVRVFDVVVPPGDATLFHTHANDYLFVSIGDANLKAEVLGGQPADLILKDGEVRFTKATITHRVINQSKAPFRNITIEVLGSPGIKEEASQSAPAGQTLVLENDRVRVWRIIIEPGQSTQMHSGNLSGLGVVVAGGTATVEEKGHKPQTVSLAAGEFHWHDGGVSHSIKNTGKQKIEIVHIEWK
ncbi:MAG TPA: hypothetical protein VNN73_12475 [Blastocatellia bacterium]|nr:hypothetical protein [Blastocatellia bacterium]